MVKKPGQGTDDMRQLAERKQSEYAPMNREAHLLTVIMGNADGIIVVNREGIVLLVNPAALAFLGRGEEEIVGELFSFPVQAGETVDLDILRKDGETAAAEMRVAEIEWEGEPAFLASLRDVTKRKQAEEARAEAERLKAEFLANTSHELRTPLHSISDFTRLMLEDEVPDPEIQKGFLSIIARQSEHLGELIDNLVDVSRTESGRLIEVSQ